MWRSVVLLKWTSVSDERFAFITLMMAAVRSPDTSVYFNKTTERYIP
jgi:hypothetical protein